MSKPLAEEIRPKDFDDFIGQEHIIGENSPLVKIVMSGRATNLIFYGPPGVGKTTLAEIIANRMDLPFYKVNASTAGIGDLREIISDSASNGNSKFILFVDEIHLFKKNIQQFLLEYTENGTIVLIGSTAENPYFTIHKAIISRCHVFEFKPLKVESVIKGLNRGIEILSKNFEDYKIIVDDNVLSFIAEMSGGDMRFSINKLEMLFFSSINYSKNQIHLTVDNAKKVIMQRVISYDRDGDSHYNTLSAFHKSLRGSDANAAIHYLARLIMAGDMQGICRRLLCVASEDVGLAYPQAVVITKACVDSALQLGFPEARLPLAEATIFLAQCPKSDSAYAAINKALEDLKYLDVGDIPYYLKDGHSQSQTSKTARSEYKYPHAYKDNYVEQQYLPDNIKDKKYYIPGENKIEKSYEEYWKRIRG